MQATSQALATMISVTLFLIQRTPPIQGLSSPWSCMAFLLREPSCIPATSVLPWIASITSPTIYSLGYASTTPLSQLPTWRFLTIAVA
uniref:Secreted protein n=1 Tax=Phakopsora pachyrhizi TaxID=170000 RepID=A0A0S1MJT8_PHAPC